MQGGPILIHLLPNLFNLRSLIPLIFVILNKHKTKWLAVLLFILSYPLELAFWKFDTAYWNKYQWDWFVFLDMKMSPAWMVKFCMDEFSEVLRAIAIFMFISSEQRLYRLLALEQLLYRSLDLICWFLWFKQRDSYPVYVVLMIIMAIVYYSHYKNKKL